jgi:hypothetical protein
VNHGNSSLISVKPLEIAFQMAALRSLWIFTLINCTTFIICLRKLSVIEITRNWIVSHIISIEIMTRNLVGKIEIISRTNHSHFPDLRHVIVRSNAFSSHCKRVWLSRSLFKVSSTCFFSLSNLRADPQWSFCHHQRCWIMTAIYFYCNKTPGTFTNICFLWKMMQIVNWLKVGY